MKSLIILVTFAVCVLRISSLENFYEFTKTFNENGYTYQCDVSESGFVTLYKKNNKWTYIPQKIKSTDEIFYVTAENYVPLWMEDAIGIASDKKMEHAINDAFVTYKEQLEGRQIFIITCINSDTGKIDEVYFEFANFGPYACIPVSVFRELETKLVGLQYTLSPLAKTFNYVYRWEARSF
ncbi:DUF5043 domain-containing protein [Bacteroides acidifaciens]|uniref:DUF5043 domain-containing protein n=1 Tax=Bacteroides acidifaciens TaxID=85831 RepID=UPI00158B8DA0|nr:DUF5043 domain-containing protein [Bacteroides acidifaciens]